MSIGRAIAKYRKLSDLTQKDLAELIGKSKPTVNHYENAVNTPPLNVINKMAEVFTQKLGTTVKAEDIISESVVPGAVQDVIEGSKKSMSMESFIVERLVSIEAKLDQLLDK